MAVIKQRQKIAGNGKRVSDGQGLRRSLAWPAGLSVRDRLKLYRLGKKDARHGIVYINEYGEITSPYCESLVQAANKRIEIEWIECNKKSFETISRLRQIEIRSESIDKLLVEATVRRDEDLETVRSLHYDGDDHVSVHLAKRRQQNREYPVVKRFEQTSSALNSELESIEAQIIPCRYAMSQAEEHARSHEQLVRADYLWRLSVYAYGASNYIKVTPDMINDSALTNAPRENHERIFSSIGADSSAQTNQ